MNASPSLSTTTDADRQLKFKVISDVLNLVVPDAFPESRTWVRRPGDAQRRVGSFYVRPHPRSLNDSPRERYRVSVCSGCSGCMGVIQVGGVCGCSAPLVNKCRI